MSDQHQIELYYKGVKAEIESATVEIMAPTMNTFGHVEFVVKDLDLTDDGIVNTNEGGAEMRFVLYEITVIDRSTGDIVLERKVTAKNVTHAIFKSRLNEGIREKGYDNYYDVNVVVDKVENSGFDLSE
jgi:hypothetical protein